MNIDALVGQVKDLAVLARAAQKQWNLAWTVYDEGEEPESTPPDDERQVLVFLNGHVGIHDEVGRQGGGWGIRLSWYRHDKHRWMEPHVTHWMDLPGPPEREEAEDPDQTIEVTPAMLVTKELLQTLYLHGLPSGRGWTNGLWDALREVAPAHLIDLANDDPKAAYYAAARACGEDPES